MPKKDTTILFGILLFLINVWTYSFDRVQAEDWNRNHEGCTLLENYKPVFCGDGDGLPRVISVLLIKTTKKPLSSGVWFAGWVEVWCGFGFLSPFSSVSPIICLPPFCFLSLFLVFQSFRLVLKMECFIYSLFFWASSFFFHCIFSCLANLVFLTTFSDLQPLDFVCKTLLNHWWFL